MSDFGDDGASPSFGIDGYVVPKGTAAAPPGYSVPKAKLEVGSAFTEVSKRCAGPGPCEYFKDSKGFGVGCRGGFMSRVDRETRKPSTAPASGGSAKASPMDSDQLTPRVLGGVMAKRDRGCYLFDRATAQSRHRVAPGKYSPQYMDAKTRTPSFGRPRRDRPSSRPGAQLGPGHYDVKRAEALCESRSPVYSVPKDPAKSFLDTLTKHSGATPGPGHHQALGGSKVEDRSGARKHSARLLADHILTPRAAAATP